MLLASSRLGLSRLSVSRPLLSATPTVHQSKRDFSPHEFYLSVLSSQPVIQTAESLCWIHDVTGMSWGGTIVAMGLLARGVFTLPASVTSQKTLVNRVHLYEEMERKVIPRLKEHGAKMEMQQGWSKMKAQAYFEKAASEIQTQKTIELNCHPAKIQLPLLIQIPLWMAISFSLRKMTTLMSAEEPTSSELERFSELSREGLLWIPDLTLADSTLILPAATGLLFLANIEISANRHSAMKGKWWMNAFFNFSRCMSLFMAYIASVLPSGMALYWASSSAFALAANILLISPRFRALVRIPKMKKEPMKPFLEVWNNFKERKLRFIARVTGYKLN